MPQVLLGDPAYPLLLNVMKEFDHCKSNKEVLFNQILRSARNPIECGLKARWRILSIPMDIPIKFLPNVIYSCFILHNFCQRENIDCDQNLVAKVNQEERLNSMPMDKINSYTTPKGRRVRDTVTAYFKE